MNESRLTDKARGFSLQTVVYSQSRKMVFYFISHCAFAYIIYCFLTFGTIMGKVICNIAESYSSRAIRVE